jgi:hypothetical protein
MLGMELAMTQAKSDYVTRESVLKLLSDEEVARISTAETATHLADGEEYLDLEALDKGVQRGGGSATPMGHVLPKRAVLADTWTAILNHLAAPRAR